MASPATFRPTLNPHFGGFQCLRDPAHRFAADSRVGDAGLGCPNCLQDGYPASVRVAYKGDFEFSFSNDLGCMPDFGHVLAYNDFPTLGEGWTPLIEMPDLAQTYGVRRVRIKNEGANPTGSHKDRMSALITGRVLALGRNTVAAATSGNAGASLAAYAARAGLKCVIIGTPQMSPVWKEAIHRHGAEIHVTETSKGRGSYLRQMVEQEGWYPATNFLDPPVGSNPFGVEGYETIAFEVVEQLEGAIPTLIIVPTARADLLWGIWHGFQRDAEAVEEEPIPRMVAVEPVSRLETVLAGADYRTHFAGAPHSMSSIGGHTVTYQGMVALQESNGQAVTISNKQALAAQARLGSSGINAELSAAASLAALDQLCQQGSLKPDDDVLLVITSHGYKEVSGRDIPV